MGTESILVVDDDETIGKMVKKMLERVGYKVEYYNNSTEALSYFRNQPDKYDLVVSDLTMPKMTGLELSKQLQMIRSGVPIIIMTGYGDNLTNETQKKYGIKKVICKPIVMLDFSNTVRKVLNK